jgi:predicted RNA-binding Zn ribbon-like protein
VDGGRPDEEHEANGLVGALAADAAPALGAPLAVEFANTIYPYRRALQDALDSRPCAANWFLARGDQFSLTFGPEDVGRMTGGDLHRLVLLRDAVRAALRAVVEGRPIPAAATAEVNAASSLSPQWPTLTGDPPTEVLLSAGVDPLAEATAMIARSAVHVLGGSQQLQVRACQTPDCPLFFIKDHPRRTWCTPACGNRARVARYNARHSVGQH